MYKTTYNHSYALIVGIDQYNHRPLHDLETAVRCANAVDEVLRSAYQFETTVLLNEQATKTNILNWLNTKQFDEDDRVLVYFAGHGLTRTVREQKLGYLALQSTIIEDWQSALDMGVITKEADNLVSKHVLLIFDTCFGGLAFGRNRSPVINSEVSIEKYLDELIARPIRYLITAGGEEAVDDNMSPDGHYSVFTHFLLTALKAGKLDSNPIIVAKELAYQLERKVAGYRQTRHKPQHGFFGVSNNDYGDFVFNRSDNVHLPDNVHQCEVIYDMYQGTKLEDDVTIVLQQFTQIEQIRVLEQITTGQSGSYVLLIYADGPPSQLIHGRHFCKIYRTDTGQETKKYEVIQKTGISKYIPSLVASTPLINGQMASLYKMAHQTDSGNSKPLSQLIHSNISAACQTILQVTTIVKEWNHPIRAGVLHPQNLLERLLRRFMPGSDSNETDIAVRLRLLIDGLTTDKTSILFNKIALPNPLVYLLNQELWEVKRLFLYPIGHIHGDLHSNNVMCLIDPDSSLSSGFPHIIDFDTYESDSCVFFDLAYLEVDLALRTIDPSVLQNRLSWLEISEYLTRTIELPELPTIEAKYLPLHFMLRPIRSHIQQICQEEPGEFAIAYWVSRTAAGLSFARKRKLGHHQRRLALLISAHSLQKALKLLGLPNLSSGTPAIIDWLDTET